MAERITSLQHPLVKHWVHLRKDRSYRYENRLLLIEGVKMVAEVGKKNRVKSLIAHSNEILPAHVKSEKQFIVSQAIIEKIAGSQAPEGLLAEIEMPSEANLEDKSPLLILDGISDPGNMGTLFRTALAFSWGGLYLLPNCCDPFNDKVLRAAKGATFRLPFCTGTWEELTLMLKSKNWQVFAADLEGISPETISPSERFALILGNESHGLSSQAKEIATKVTLPISQEIESLNVSIAGSILMFLWRKM